MSDYDIGVLTCEEGRPCPMTASLELVRGYSEEYARQQCEDAKSDR